MKTFAARDFIKNYGTVADMVAAGEPVRVTKHGRAAYFMVPPSAIAEEFLRQLAVSRFVTTMDHAKTTPAAQDFTDEALVDLINAHD